MDYLSHNGHQLVTKNKLQEAVQKYLKTVDRQLLQGKYNLKLFKKTVLAKIDELNKEHSRCKPIVARWMEMEENDYLLLGAGFSHFQIFHAKKTF